MKIIVNNHNIVKIHVVYFTNESSLNSKDIISLKPIIHNGIITNNVTFIILYLF
jgi:hypothetical protein